MDKSTAPDDRDPTAGDRDPAVGESVELTILARLAGVQIVHVRRYLEFGLFESRGLPSAMPARFDPSSAARVARAERLRRDLDLNYAGAVLVVELLDRISELDARLRRSSGD